MRASKRVALVCVCIGARAHVDPVDSTRFMRVDSTASNHTQQTSRRLVLYRSGAAIDLPSSLRVLESLESTGSIKLLPDVHSLNLAQIARL